ncbi:RNA-dependent RNA polymerase [Fimicolochytrium jonesii]|uniref:RNA-dependent RNA polymerase n=1 Tax=Fimicolochytrium jonesii TaxID=1396493 RepID=UPI0022FE5A56|nr:RNA-dependent RNA polymerase [Fimicolochytrium jonesii]KAI8823533.1 RNA-dependent RNA polymerase [Fimicolochytrium jonesii]
MSALESAGVKNPPACTRIRLMPPATMLGHRAARKFGADRFLTVKFADLSQVHLVRGMRYDQRRLHVLGRVWELVQEKDELTARFFATGSYADENEMGTPAPMIEPVSVDDFVRWHIPMIPENMDIKWAKIAARLDLAFSGTMSGIYIEDHHVIPDIRSSDGPGDDVSHVMTDGCGLISYAAMCRLRAHMGWSELPCAIQGRFGSCKGVWVIDPKSFGSTDLYLRSRESMRKFHLPTPTPESEIPFHSTLEIIRPSRPMPGLLNKQIIPILHCGRVPVQTFIHLLDEMLVRVKDRLDHPDPIMVRKELEGSGSVFMTRFGLEKRRDSKEREAGEEERRTRNEEDRNFFERCIKMIAAGFLPKENAYLCHSINGVFNMLCKQLLSKFNIAVPKSRRILMVPDPTETLHPGQIFLHLPDERDEETGARLGVLAGPVLVTRNPAYLPTDVQKVTMVDAPMLHRYENVVVFPVTGDGRSLASFLGGGDYDGDDCMVIWDTNLVEPFINSLEEEPEGESVSAVFKQDTRTVGDVLCSEPARLLGSPCRNTAYPSRSPHIAAGAIADELFERFCKSSTGDLVGVYSNRHAYTADGKGVDHPDSIWLAKICAELLDARKAGKAGKRKTASITS